VARLQVSAAALDRAEAKRRNGEKRLRGCSEALGLLQLGEPSRATSDDDENA